MSLSYILSNEADIDLDEIFDYTQKEPGFEQAVKYLTNLEETFHKLCDYPNLGRVRSELRDDLHSIVIGRHVVFYSVLKKHILIVRILHQSRYLPLYF